jgi:hypothetical protein
MGHGKIPVVHDYGTLEVKKNRIWNTLSSTGSGTYRRDIATRKVLLPMGLRTGQ